MKVPGFHMKLQWNIIGIRMKIPLKYPRQSNVISIEIALNEIWRSNGTSRHYTHCLPGNCLVFIIKVVTNPRLCWSQLSEVLSLISWALGQRISITIFPLPPVVFSGKPVFLPGYQQQIPALLTVIWTAFRPFFWNQCAGLCTIEQRELSCMAHSNSWHTLPIHWDFYVLPTDYNWPLHGGRSLFQWIYQTFLLTLSVQDGDVDNEKLAPNGHGQLWARLLELVLYVVLIIPQRHFKRAFLKAKGRIFTALTWWTTYLHFVFTLSCMMFVVSSVFVA